MSKPTSRTRPELESSELWLSRACLIVALGISIFLAWSSLRGGGVPGCGPESGCDKVLSSRWAYVFNWPISLFALPVYALLLALVRPRNPKWSAITPLALVIIASALWFVGIQAFVLRSFCKFCMTAHAAGVLAALVLLRRTTLPFPKLALSAGLAVAAVAGIAAAEAFSPERGPKFVKELVATNSVSGPHPTFTVIDGQYTLDLTKVPVAGPLNAPKKVAKLFDYTCHHCRDLHHLLEPFRRQHSNELAVISLPMPLDSECNSIVRRTAAPHVNGCKYASFGLAVFLADPAKFEEFTDYIYAPERPPSVEEARAFAAKLVGSANFERALQDPAIGERIRTDIEMYKSVYRKTRSGQIPQMYFSEGASIGAVETKEQLEKIMAENLGFPLPAK